MSVLLGQGSGGPALAMVPADRVLAALHGWLAPLPPEGASAIVFRDIDHAPELAAAQGIRSADLLRPASSTRSCLNIPTPPTSRSSSPRGCRRRSLSSCTRCVRCPTPNGWRPVAALPRHRLLRDCRHTTATPRVERWSARTATRGVPTLRAIIRQNGRHGHWWDFTSGLGRRRRLRRARLAGTRPAAVRIRGVDRGRRRRGPAQRHRDPAGRDRARHQHARAGRRQRGDRTARHGQRRAGLRAVRAQLGRRPGGRPGGRRRRLPGQTVRAGRAGRAGEGAAAPPRVHRDVVVGDHHGRPAGSRHPRVGGPGSTASTST